MAISEFYLEEQAIEKKLQSLGDNPKLSPEDVYNMLRRVSKMVDIIAGEWDEVAKQLEVNTYRITFDDNKCFRVMPPDTGMRPSGWKIEATPHPATTTMSWIENFKAFHPKWGTVEGNFNHTVIAHGGKTSYNEFVKAHPRQELYWSGVKQ